MLKRGVGFKNQFWLSERFLGTILLNVFGSWNFQKILGPPLIRNDGFCIGLRGFRAGLRGFRAGLRGLCAGLRSFPC